MKKERGPFFKSYEPQHLFRILYGVKTFFGPQPISRSFNIVVTDILTFVVIIELFRSFIEYFEVHRFRIYTMIDPAIVFVIRELIIKLYDHETLNGLTPSGFGLLLLSLGVVRTLSVRFSPGEDRSSHDQTRSFSCS